MSKATTFWLGMYVGCMNFTFLHQLLSVKCMNIE